MKKFLYLLPLILLFIVYNLFYQQNISKNYDINNSKKDNILPTITRDSKIQQNTINSAIEKIDLEEIMAYKVNTRRVKKIWSKIQEKGFDSPDIIRLLSALENENGEFVYYKELRNAVKNGTNDEVTAYIIELLAGAYDGNDDYTLYHLPKNKKDEIIQELIKDQLINPRGTASLYMALKKLPYAYNNTETQSILDEFLNNDKSPIKKTDIYKLKVRHGSLAIDGNILNNVLTNINYLKEDEQQEILPEIFHASQTIADRENNEQLRETYIDIIKQHMPTTPNIVKVDYDIIEKQLENFEIKLDDKAKEYLDKLPTDKEKNKFYDEYIEYQLHKFQSEKVDEQTKNDNYNLYVNSIDAIAIASITKEQDLYQTYKKMYFENDSLRYKLTILERLWIKYEGEYREQFQHDNDFKKELQLLKENPSLSNYDRETVEWYLQSN